MTSRPLTSLLLLAAVGLVGGVGCSKRPAEPKARATAPVATAASSEVAKGETPHGSRKMKQLDVPVWVDGKQVSVLRYGELSAALKPQTRFGAEEAGGEARYYSLDEYAQSLGIAPAKIKSIHVVGNRDKVATIKGSELTAPANKGRFQFDFMQETTGSTKVDWDTTGLADTYVVHEMRALSIYVEKAPPVVDPAQHCHLAKDAAGAMACSFDDPYATAEKMKGTRFYMDGRLVGYVKRREIKESVVVGDNANGEHLYSVIKLAQQFGVDASQVRAAELLNGDDVIARATADAWHASSNQLSFTLPKHQHGKVNVRIPASLQVGVDGAKDADATVTAVLLFKNTTPRARELTAVANVVESPAAAGEVANNDQEDRPTDKLGGGRQN